MDGVRITTVEGLAVDGELSRCSERSSIPGAAQCGFCIPGQLVSAQALLDRVPHPSARSRGRPPGYRGCAGYEQIFEAVLAAANGAGSRRRAGAESGPIVAPDAEVAPQ